MKKAVAAIIFTGIILCSFGCSEQIVSDQNVMMNKEMKENINIISQNPQKNIVTYEINEKLIGRYVAEVDKDMYFEIMPDGHVELSLVDVADYDTYTSDMTTHKRYSSNKLFVTAYYCQASYDEITYLTFHLVDGIECLCINKGQMAIEFNSSPHSMDTYTIRIRDRWVNFVKKD